MCAIYRGLTFSPKNISNWNGVKVLRSSNVLDNQFIESDDDIFVEQNCINVPFVESGDILVTAASGSSELIGKHAFIPEIKSNYAVAGGFMLLIRSLEFSKIINIIFQQNNYKEYIKLNSLGGNGSIGNLNKSIIENYVSYFPSKNETNLIVNFFENITNIITFYKR
ncbi:restriction endonuclease subunit S domain-containing protein [Mycoplasma sp. Z463D]